VADESKVLVRLRLLGAQLMARDAKRAAGGLKELDRGGRGAARGLGQIRGGKVQGQLGLISRGSVLAKRGMRGVETSAIAAGRALRTVGVAAGALAAGGLLTGVKQGADFEQQMANVQSRLMTTKGNMALLTDQALDLGAKTQFSAGQAASGMDQLAAAGFTTQQILRTLPGTLSLAAASGTDLAASAELQGAAIRGFGLRASAAGHVADVLALTVNKSALEMSDLAETLPYVASTARQTGTSLEQVAAAAGILGNAGIKGSMAGTALRTSMLRLTDPTKKMGDRLAAMGIEAKDLAAQPLPKVIGMIAGGLRKLPTRGEKVGAISAIFGKEAAPAMLNLMARGRKGIDAFTRALERSKGAAQKAADIQRTTVKGAWDNFAGSVETASIKLTKRFQPALRRALNSAAGGVNKLTDALPGLAGALGAGISGRGAPGETRTIRSGPTGRKSTVRADPTKAQQIAAKIGGVLRTIGTVAADAGRQLLDAFKPAMPFFQNILLPLLTGIGKGVLGSVVAAFRVLVPVIKIVATVLGFVGKAAAPLRPVIEGIGMVIGFLLGGPILKALGMIPKLGIVFRLLGLPLRIVTGAVRGVARVVGGLVRGFLRAHQMVARFAGTLSGGARKAAVGAVNMVGGIINVIARLPGRAAALAGRVITSIVSRLGRGASRVASAAGKLGKGLVDGAIKIIKSAPGAIVDALLSLVPGPV
jgi:TP901 family phage tail tape measure protein